MDQLLMDACAVLFGTQAGKAGPALLGRLSAAEVKRAFRRLALSTHPDTASGLASGPAGASRFIEALRAYELLASFLRGRGGRPAPSRPPAGAAARASGPRANPKGPAGPSGSRAKAGAAGASAAGGAEGGFTRRRAGGLYYRGPVPERRLRFAEYLYYSGLISWETLIEAIVWQRRGRLRFGEIAREFRWISREEIARVLRSRRHAEPMGQAAVRLRLLSDDEVAAILRRQRARQKPIGRYFVATEKMTPEELARRLFELLRHNARCRNRE
jgi:hypothetical protein